MTFLGGGPLGLFPLFLLTLSLEFESSFSTTVEESSLSSLDFLETLLGRGDALALLEDLSDSDSELLSGENILFFFDVLVSAFGFGAVLPVGLGVFAPALRGTVLPLASTVATVFGLAEHRLLGGKGLGLTSFGVSSSLDDITFTLDGLLGFCSSFFLGSSTFVGDFGAGVVVVAGVSEVEDSESELLDADPELVDELSLLLESELDPELLSELLLLTWKFE